MSALLPQRRPRALLFANVLSNTLVHRALMQLQKEETAGGVRQLWVSKADVKAAQKTMTGPERLVLDNMLAYFQKTGTTRAERGDLSRALWQDAWDQSRAVAGKDGKLTGLEPTRLPDHLKADFLYLTTERLEGESKDLHRELAKVAGDVTLGMFGEDSGSSAKAHLRNGPFSALTADAALEAFQFDAAAQKRADEFSFTRIDPRDAGFWADFVDSQFDPVAAERVKELLSGSQVVELAAMVVADQQPFSTPVYLVARTREGSFVALRGTVGGMSL